MKENKDLERSPLYKILPLQAPLNISVFVSNVCNFRCKYCHQVLSKKDKKRLNFKEEFMNMALYKKVVDDIGKFNDKLKSFIIYGNGEPLLNPNIVDMVAYAKEKNIAEKVVITTNASMLTPELSKGLIDAGLDNLRISIQGVSREKYKEICGVDIDFEKFIENIRCFYMNKKNTSMYIKIIDVALDNSDDKETFYNLFSKITDSINIEHASPLWNDVDYSSLNMSFSQTEKGYKIKDVLVCPKPFFNLNIDPDGSVMPCCSVPIPCIYGNISEEALKEIWNGEKVKEFFAMHLEGKRNEDLVCKECNLMKYTHHMEDDLDAYRVELLKKYTS